MSLFLAAAAGGLHAQVTAITFQTIPTGFGVLVDNVSHAAPVTLNLTHGAHTVSVPNPSPTQYFQSWSAGGAATHTITVGPSPATYTATFVVIYSVNTFASPSSSVAL